MGSSHQLQHGFSQHLHLRCSTHENRRSTGRFCHVKNANSGGKGERLQPGIPPASTQSLALDWKQAQCSATKLTT
jgi:hypothetical protein